MGNSFYNSWISLTVFVGLIIFIPYQASFFSFKVADIWLWLCLALQSVHGLNRSIQFKSKKFVKYFGLWVGILAIIATLFQAWQDKTPINPSFFSEFYRFFRYFLIFKLVENVVLNSNSKELRRFLYSIIGMGAIVIILAFFEFYSVGPIQKVILSFYYVVPDQSFEENLEEFGRLLGVLGNSNTTAIFLTSTLVFPVCSVALRGESILNKMLLISYVLFACYVISAMTSSRTSIIISIILFLFVFILSSSKGTNFRRFFFLTVVVLAVGVFFYNHYGSNNLFSDRLVFFFEGKNTKGEKVGFIESMGRNELWNQRISTFKRRGNTVAFLTGMGYTKVYKDYSDNGMLSSFINGGLIGLVLRLILYYIIFRYSFWNSLKKYRRSELNFFSMILGAISIVYVLWELTVDMVEHIKIGQIFYLFFSMSLVCNAKSDVLRRRDSPPLTNRLKMVQS
jgi:O-antigen ligase